jgi:hypothetical protein
MPTKRPRGDAVAIAQQTKIVAPTSPGAFSLAINGKYLEFSQWIIADIVAAWNGTTTPVSPVAEAAEFAEITASADGNNLLLTADEPGRPFEVRLFVGGQDATNQVTDEVQTVTIGNAPTGGTFTLTFSGQTTAAIAYNATAAAVQSALEALSNIGVAEALVTGNAGGPYTVRFAGTLADSDQPLMTASAANLTGGTAAAVITTLTDGQAGTSEIQTVKLHATAGTFTLSFAGATTGNIAWNASAATVQTALNNLATIGTGNSVVTGGPLPNTLTITFQGALANLDLPQITGNASGLTSDCDVTIAELTAGAGGIDLILDIAVGLQYGAAARWVWQYDHAGVTQRGTTEISTASSATAIADALCELPIIGANNVTGTTHPTQAVGAARLTFVNKLRAATDVTKWAHTRLRLMPVNTADAALPNLIQYPTGTNEVQRLSYAGTVPTAGTFTLSYGGQTTAPIPWNATLTQIQTALEALSTIGAGALIMSGAGFTGGTPTIEFAANGLQASNLALLTQNSTGLKVAVTTTTPGVTGIRETQQVTLTNNPTGGTLTLTRGANTTGALAYNASAATVQSALEGLASVGVGNVLCTGGPWPAAISCSFAPSLGNIAQMTAAATLHNGTVTVAELTKGGIAVGVIEQRRSRGPNHWDDPTNWLPEGIPDSGDIVALDGGEAELLYGLEQRTTFTADAASDVITLTSGRKTFQAGQKVRVRSTGTLPGGLSAGTDYYAIAVGTAGGQSTENRLQLSTSLGGAPVNITTAGTGTHTITVALAELRAPARFRGKLGLPARDGDILEYRPLYLALDCPLVTIGAGAGLASGRIKLDCDTVATVVQVHDTAGASDTDEYSFSWKGTNAANTFEQLGGECGIAYAEGETAQLGTVTLRAGTLELGPAVTLGTLRRTGGTLISQQSTVSASLQLSDG